MLEKLNAIIIERTRELSSKYETLNDEETLRIAKVLAQRELTEDDYRADIKKLLLSNSTTYNIGDNLFLGKHRHQLNQSEKRVSTCKLLVKISTLNSPSWGATTITAHNNELYTFRFTHFEPMSAEFISSTIKDLGIELQLNPLDFEDYKFVKECEAQMMHSAHRAILPPVNDTYVNLLNGTLVISRITGTSLIRHSPKLFFTYCLPFPYLPKTKAPKFQKFLDEVLPDKGAQNALLEFFASCFISNTSDFKIEKALFLKGTGSNGKSVVHDIFRATLGKHNVSSVSLELLSKNNFSLPLIDGKLLNFASEIGTKFESTVFKALVSQEGVTVDRKNEKMYEMERHPRLAFNCNELPTSQDRTPAVIRRMLIIPFDVTIGEANRNPRLAETIIQEELTGVFNLIMDGLIRLHRNKAFSKSELIDGALVDYKKSMNTVHAFCEMKGLIPDSNSWYGLEDFYLKEYVDFCSKEQLKPVNSFDFKKLFEAEGFEKGRSNAGVNGGRTGWHVRIPLSREAP